MASPGKALYAATSGVTTTTTPVAGPSSSPGAGLYNAVTGAPAAKAAAPTHAGGVLGAVESIPGIGHGVKEGLGAVHQIEGVAGTVANKVASTTENIGTGLYKLGNDALNPDDNTVHGIGALVHGHFGTAATDLVDPKAWANVGNLGYDKQAVASDPLGQDVKAIGTSTATSVVHPLRDPVNTALTAFTIASLGAGGAAKLGYAARVLGAAKVGETGDLVVAGSKAAKAAEAAGLSVEPLTTSEKAALLGKTAIPFRYRAPTSLRIIRAPVTRLVKPEDGAEGPAAAVKGSQPVMLQASHNHLMRWYQAAHDAIVQHAIDNAGAEPGVIAKYGMGRVSKSLGEGIRTTANERSVLERSLGLAGKSFDKGVTKKEGQLALFLRSANVTAKEAADYWAEQARLGNPTEGLAKTAQSIDDKSLLEIGPDGNIRVTDSSPKLQRAEALTAEAQAAREGALVDHGLMTPEGLASRKALVAETIGSEAARNAETGVREGQGYTPLKTSEKLPTQTPFTQSRAQGVITAVKNFAVGKEATGGGIAKGLIPDNTTAGIARALHEINRYVNTVEFRGRAAQLGSDIRQTTNDVLIRDPQVATQGEIPEDVEELLKRRASTLHTLPEEEQVGIGAGIRAKLADQFPGIDRDSQGAQLERTAMIGTRAPEGYKWVPKQLIPKELTRVATPRSGLAKFADNVNSAVTAATVYLKLGHFPTRFLTDLSTNAVQGSAADAMLTPFGMGKSARLAKQLTEDEKVRLASVTGTHGYEALPHAGTGRIAAVATKGAGWWARHVDAPFRLNAILYELRQIGYDTAAGVREALAYIHDPQASTLSFERGAQIDQAVREANRASIMYDGLGDIEQRYIARVLWFYPWTKGAARFAFHTVAAHPVKALALAQTGALGAAYQHGVLGPVPSYEEGLTPFTGGAHPLTGNLASLTPFSTLGTVAQMAQHPLREDTGIASQANPTYTGLIDLIRGHGLGTALSDVGAPTPELQAIDAYLHPPGPNRMFGSTNTHLSSDPRVEAFLSALLRAAAGTAVPRPVNKAVLNTAAQHEREKHHTITVYGS